MWALQTLRTCLTCLVARQYPFGKTKTHFTIHLVENRFLHLLCLVFDNDAICCDTTGIAPQIIGALEGINLAQEFFFQFVLVITFYFDWGEVLILVKKLQLLSLWIDSLTVSHTGNGSSHSFCCCSLTTPRPGTISTVTFMSVYMMTRSFYKPAHSCGLRIGQAWTFRLFSDEFRALPCPSHAFGHSSHSDYSRRQRS